MAKILLATFTFFPNRDGVAESSLRLAEGLKKLGHFVEVVCGYPDKNSSETDPCPVSRFRIHKTSGARGEWVGEVDSYRAFLQRGNWDVVIFQCGDVWSTVLGEDSFQGRPTKTIMVSHGYSTHGWTPVRKFPWGLGAWLRGVLETTRLPGHLRKFDHVVFLEDHGDWGRFLDVRVAKLCGFKRWSAIPNGVDHGEFREQQPLFRPSLGLGDAFLVLCVANYSDRKNQMLALNAFVTAHLKNAVLCFIGSELNDYALKVKIRARQLLGDEAEKKILFLENVSREMTCAALREADVFLLTAKQETQPIVILEAMAAGLPFISTPTGCVRHLPGGMVARGRGGLAAALCRLEADRSFLEKLGERGRFEARRRYDWNRTCTAFDHLIRTGLGQEIP